jgi:hypothetical protein
MAADDIHRGIDVVSWTGRPNLAGAVAATSSSGVGTGNLGLLALALVFLPGAAVLGRRRRTLSQAR